MVSDPAGENSDEVLVFQAQLMRDTLHAPFDWRVVWRPPTAESSEVFLILPSSSTILVQGYLEHKKHLPSLRPQ